MLLLPISVKKLEFVRGLLCSRIFAAKVFFATLSVPPYEKQLADDDPLLMLDQYTSIPPTLLAPDLANSKCATLLRHRSRVAGTEVVHPRDLLELLFTMFPMNIG
jgi:hypothetical protein